MSGRPVPDVVNPATGQIEPCAGCTERDTDYELLDDSLRKERRSNQALRRELAKMHAEDPDADDISTVLEAWRYKTGHPRADISLDCDRAAKVRAMLKRPGWDVARCLLVVEGAAARPYVVNAERQRTGEPNQRYDDITTIFRDPSIAERMEKYGLEKRLGPMADWMMVDAFLSIRELCFDAGLEVAERGVYACLVEALKVGPFEERAVTHHHQSPGENLSMFSIEGGNVVPLRRTA